MSQALHPGYGQSGSGQQRNHFTGACARPDKRLPGRLRAKRGAFHADHLDVGHAEKSQDVFQPWYLEVERRVLARIDTTARAYDYDALAGHEALWPGLAVAERAAGARDVIDPGFQGRGDAEIDHWRANDHDIGGEELVNQRVRLREDR